MRKELEIEIRPGNKWEIVLETENKEPEKAGESLEKEKRNFRNVGE